MSEEKESGDLVRIKAGVDPSTSAVSGEVALSDKWPHVIGRMLPVKWLGNREATRALCERLKNKLANGEQFTESEADVANALLSEPIAKFIRLNSIVENATVIVEERISGGESPDALQLPANASSSDSSGADASRSTDWGNRFREDAGLVDDETIADLYSRILAEEEMKPGSVSRRTLGVLRDLDVNTAKSFLKVVAVLVESDMIPQQREPGSPALEVAGLDHRVLLDLDDAGLINAGADSVRSWEKAARHYVRLPMQKKIVQAFQSEGGDFSLELKVHMLTPAGRQLARLLPVDPSDEQAEALLRWIQASAKGTTLLVADLPSPRWEGPANSLSWQKWNDEGSEPKGPSPSST